MATLPHERERMFLDDIIDDCLVGRNKFVVVVTSPRTSVRFLIEESIKICENLKPEKSKQILIFREALEFDSGAKIVFYDTDRPQFLRGLKPDRIVITGPFGELWYLMTQTGATIEAVA